jgi:hypothetical protein
MKTRIIASFLLLAGLNAGAQYVPDHLNYQAVLTDDRGQPKVNVTNGVNFRIYDEAEGGNLIWGEYHSVTTSPKGLFSVVLGTAPGLNEHMAAANLRGAFASGTLVEQRYLELQALNSDGTTQSPILPRQRFLTVPYAFQANDSQNASGNFQVSGALYSGNVGMEVNRLVMTNAQGALTVAGDLRVDGYGKTGVTALFGSNSVVKGMNSDAVRVDSNLTANQTWTIAGTGVLYRGASVTDPTFQKGLHVKGGVRAFGAYQTIGTNLSSLASRTAAGDGFALIYYKTDDWGEDADLIVTIKGTAFHLQHHPYSAGKENSLHFYDSACFPISKGTSWSIAFDSGDHSHTKFDVYWIPFGY